MIEDRVPVRTFRLFIGQKDFQVELTTYILKMRSSHFCQVDLHFSAS